MVLQLPQPVHSPCKHCGKQQPAFVRFTSARRCRSRSARQVVVDTAQVIDQDVTSSAKDQSETLVAQLNSRADPNMHSRVQVPRNKVLTTTMIAHATNKDLKQVNATPPPQLGGLSAVVTTL